MAVPADLAFRPIVIETNVPGRPRTINSVRDAARALLYWPPDQRGDTWRVACEACYAALAGTLEPETARKAFVQAAMVAGTYVRGGGDRKGSERKPPSGRDSEPTKEQ